MQISLNLLRCAGVSPEPPSNLNFFSNSTVSKFEENDIQVTVYADNNISKVQAQNLWSNNVASIFIDDPTEYN